MTIYFLRHGESEANVAHVFAGQKDDSPLTELGRQQAKVAAESLLNTDIGLIVTTSLSRARETAEIVGKLLDIQKIKIDDRLIEYDMGTLTGQPNQEISSRDLIAAEGAEDPRTFNTRVIEALKEYSKTNQNVLLVSHAGTGRIIETNRMNRAPEQFYDVPAMPNARATVLDLDWLK